MIAPTTRMQDAVRLLMLIEKAADPLEPGEPGADPALKTAVGVVRTQVRLQKLDFWVRNPDYLANELLNDYESSGEVDLLGIAGDILDSEEPELRRYPMLRYLFGAYEDLDDALSVLRQADLVVVRRRGNSSHISRTDYYLLEAGRLLAERIGAEHDELRWYAARSQLVVDLASGQGATQLKDRQYVVATYVNTPHGQRIPSITDQARQRLAALRASAEGPSA